MVIGMKNAAKTDGNYSFHFPVTANQLTRWLKFPGDIPPANIWLTRHGGQSSAMESMFIKSGATRNLNAAQIVGHEANDRQGLGHVVGALLGTIP